MRIVVIGDVGVLDDMVHIGDEAMFEEFVTQARLHGATSITALSANPAETTARYGVDAVLNVGFAPGVVGDRDGQVDRMRRVLGAAAGDASLLTADDHAWSVIAAVREADGVAVSGGGNMASIWPMHIFERATLGGLASLFGKPFVVSGQTIGPALVGDDRDLTAALLSSADLVGLRESASFQLVQDLGVPVAQITSTIDDASFVGVSSPEHVAERPYCAVTLAAHTGDTDRELFAEATARLLDRVADETGLEIVFFAHFGSLVPGDERGDSVAHRRVIDRMTKPSRIEPTTGSVSAAQFSRGASFVVSSRYHPVVFAVSAGVPTIGIAVDDYTTVKLTGALGNFGQSGVVSAADLVAGRATERALSTWADRAAITKAWADRVPAAREASDIWWSKVAAVLGGDVASPVRVA